MSLERKYWMETLLKQICQLIVQGISSTPVGPGPIIIHTECAVSNLWQPLRLATISPHIAWAFCRGPSAAWANGLFVVLPLQSGESLLSPSAVSQSDSASSTQSLSHGGAPELLVGLSYNATTGRLSVEMIKGSHFRNLAVNRAPGECTAVSPALVLPGPGRRLCLLSS